MKLLAGSLSEESNFILISELIPTLRKGGALAPVFLPLTIE